MLTPSNRKVTPRHLGRKAFLYVRQSTLRQVIEHSESTERQYALRERAVALGWPPESIVIIDADLGQSGASSADREGFRRLVSEVGMGNAGIVMGLEVSRLARKSSDWHHLLEICALTETLLLDEDDVYDPRNFNDRLVLGLKGTMSEAELHVLKARLQGGILNKARRGELEIPLPAGFVYDQERRVRFDPDQRVREAIRHFFETFRRTGSASATVKHFHRQGMPFPRRPRSGPRKGENIWAPLTHSLALRMLHNPRYAGVFFFGRRRTWKDASGRQQMCDLPQEEWLVFLPDAHEGYITREQYEENRRQLAENCQARNNGERRGPPREGPALLQGLAICGKCGRRMGVRYQARRGLLFPVYVCQKKNIEKGEPLCEHIPGAALDEAIGRLLLDTVTPLALDVALAVQEELTARFDEADALRKKTVERARYEVEQARRRYMQVDPDNRHVAATLEAEWNEKLRALDDAQEEYERKKEEDRFALTAETKRRLATLTTDFPRLWRDPQTPMREKKRMAKLIIEDVTIRRGPETLLNIRFRGGATKTLRVPAPISGGKLRQTSPEVVAEVDRLLDRLTDGEIAKELDRRGYRSGCGNGIRGRTVGNIRRAYGLKSRYDRLRERGFLTVVEMAGRLDVAECTVHGWRHAGRLTAHRYNDKGDLLYEPPGPDAPKKYDTLRRRLRTAGAPVSTSSTP